MIALQKCETGAANHPLYWEHESTVEEDNFAQIISPLHLLVCTLETVETSQLFSVKASTAGADKEGAERHKHSSSRPPNCCLTMMHPTKLHAEPGLRAGNAT